MPERGDAVATWLKKRRDDWVNDGGDPRPPQWFVIDELLEDYRLHADTGTPLNEHACDGAYCCFEKDL